SQSPLFTFPPCKMIPYRGHPFAHVSNRRSQRTRCVRSTSHHSPQRLRASFRFRDRCRAHLLLLSSHRTRRSHRQAASQHRRRHFFQRPPHGLSTRAFRIRSRKYQPPIRLVFPSRPSFLQFRAAKPALCPHGPYPGLRPPCLSLLRRRIPRHLRTGRRPRLVLLSRTFLSPSSASPRNPSRHLACRPDVASHTHPK